MSMARSTSLGRFGQGQGLERGKRRKGVGKKKWRKGSRRQGRRQKQWWSHRLCQATVGVQQVRRNGASRTGMSYGGRINVDHQMQLLPGSRTLDECLYIVWRWEVCAGASMSERTRERNVTPGGGRRMATTATTKQHVGHCSAGAVDVLELGVSRAMDADGRRTEYC